MGANFRKIRMNIGTENYQSSYKYCVMCFPFLQQEKRSIVTTLLSDVGAHLARLSTKRCIFNQIQKYKKYFLFK